MVKVLVAVGHGTRPDGTFDPGAVAGSKSEQSEGDPICRAMTDVLVRAGVEVRLIPRSGANWHGASAIANTWGADYAVEVHHDWSGAPRGSFGHWASATGKRVADAMLARVINELDYPIRPTWHRARPELAWLRRTAMPAVLWECDRIGEMREHRAYGEALGRGVLDFLGIDPAGERDWFDMATREDLREVVREELERERPRTARDVWRQMIQHGGMAEPLRASLLLSRLQGGGLDDVLKRLEEVSRKVRQIAREDT